MKHLLIAAILLLAIGNASAQKPRKWTRLRGPNMGNATHILMFGANQEIIAQDTFGYYVTTNDGATWDYRRVFSGYKVPIRTNYTLYSSLATSESGNYFFAFGAAKDDYGNTGIEGVYRSTDFGSTWKMVLKEHAISQLFTGDNGVLLFLTADAVLWESIDNGSSWVQIAANLQTSSRIVASNSNGIFTSNGNIYRIANDSQTSVLFTSGIPSCNANYVVSLGNNKLLTMSCNTVYISDGVNPWDSIGTYSNNIYAPIKGNGDTLTAAAYFINNNSYNFYVAMSTDLGKTWNSIGDFKQISPSGYSTIGNYANANKFLYEDSRGLFTSTDRGATWKEIGLPYAQIHSVLVSNDGRIFADNTLNVYTNNFVLSSDKGLSWENINADGILGHGIAGSIISGARDSYVWEFDTTIPTQWKEKSSIGDLSPDLITSDGSKFIYIAGGSPSNSNASSIYRSDDSAFSWINVNAPDDANYISALDASSDGTVYFGTYPIMYRSEDHGATWTKLEPLHDIVQLSYIKTFDADGILLGTQGDGLLLSTNKGNSWARIDGNNFDTVTCIAINSKGEVAAGTNRGLWTSDATKMLWSKVTLGRDDNLYIGGIDVAANDDFYAGTYGSSLWMGTRNYNSEEYSHDDNSAMRISPNPASGRIRIDLPGGQIRVELFDMLGRRISIVADRNSEEQQLYFNVSNLATGVYTLALSGAKNETQKLIVSH